MHVPIEHELRGQHFLWDGVQVDFLWPEIPPEEVAPLAKNNDSLVVRLRYVDRTFLLPGDAEKQVEAAMLAENDAAALHADVLKVGHHGSKNSTMPDFLAAVAPQISIISAGEENPYGHPQPGTDAAAGGERDAAAAHGSRRRGARGYGWALAAGGDVSWLARKPWRNQRARQRQITASTTKKRRKPSGASYS